MHVPNQSASEGVSSGSASPKSSVDEYALPSILQKKGMNAIILGQMVGSLGGLAFSNGLLLLLLAKVGFGGASSLLILSLPSIIQPLLILPFAHFGKRNHRLMMIRGFSLSTFGFVLICTLGWSGWHGRSILLPVVVGIIAYSIGVSMSTASWYALLDPLVPKYMRGSFFGKLRLSWRFCGFIFGIISTFILSLGHGIYPLEIIFIVITIGMFYRVVLMRAIPSARESSTDLPRIIPAILHVIHIPGYAGFCCYVFLLTLVTENAVTLLPLIERYSTGYSDIAVVSMGCLLGIGAVLSFYVSGKLVDRIGTRPVFLMCHACFAILFIAVLCRGFLTIPNILWMGLQNFLYGVASAGVSVAVSTEMLALVPSSNKGLSTGLCTTLQLAGAGLSGLLSAVAIKLGILNEHWKIAGSMLTAYDTLIFGDAILVLLLVVTLGLVPSVLARNQKEETQH